MRIKKGIEINFFANKWSSEFWKEQLDINLIQSELKKDALELGFVNDNFASLKEEFDEDFETQEDLYWVLHYVDDENIIGNMILSKYEECINNDSLLDNKTWFYDTFSHLEDITDKYLEMFRGSPLRLELISNSLKDGDDFYWQEFQLDRNGNAVFKKIIPSIDTEKPQQEDTYVIPKEQAKKILKDVVTALNQDIRNNHTSDDFPNWDMKVYNTNQDQFYFCGCYSQPLMLNEINISREIRTSIDEKDMMLFDGTGDIIATNDQIRSVVLEYHHERDVIDEVVDESYHIVVDEKVIVDCEGDTVSIESRFNNDAIIKHQYYAPQSVHWIVDDFSADSFFKEIKERPSNIVPIPDQEFTYKITVNYESAKSMELCGEYDQLGLPTDFPQFIESLVNFFRHYGLGECVNPDVFARRRRKSNEVNYISVIFEEDSEDTYYYLCEDDRVEIGDIVVVPAGEENELKLTRVVDIEYFDPKDVPYPIDEVKKMVRIATTEDFARTFNHSDLL